MACTSTGSACYRTMCAHVHACASGLQRYLRDESDLVAQRDEKLGARVLEGSVEHLREEGDVLWRHLVLEGALDEAALEQHEQRPLVAAEGRHEVDVGHAVAQRRAVELVGRRVRIHVDEKVEEPLQDVTRAQRARLATLALDEHVERHLTW